MAKVNSPARRRAIHAGRKGDDVIGHLTKGEIVIPKELASDKDFKAVLTEYFKGNGVSLEKFTVGSDKNAINPKTGYKEFGFFSKVLREIKRPFEQAMEGIFGKVPDPPEVVKQTPIEKVLQSNIAKQGVLRRYAHLAKRRKAALSQPNVSRKVLGAA